MLLLGLIDLAKRTEMTTTAQSLEPGIHDVPLQGIMVVEEGIVIQAADGWFYVRKSHPNYDAMLQLIMAAGVSDKGFPVWLRVKLKAADTPFPECRVEADWLGWRMQHQTWK